MDLVIRDSARSDLPARVGDFPAETVLEYMKIIPTLEVSDVAGNKVTQKQVSDIVVDDQHDKSLIDYLQNPSTTERDTWYLKLLICTKNNKWRRAK